MLPQSRSTVVLASSLCGATTGAMACSTSRPPGCAITRETERGPRARLVELPEAGHAPALMAANQIAVVKDWLLAP